MATVSTHGYANVDEIKTTNQEEFGEEDGYFTCAVSVQHKVRHIGGSIYVRGGVYNDQELILKMLYKLVTENIFKIRVQNQKKKFVKS